MRPRRVSKAIQVGDVTVGGNAPITVQSMTKTDTPGREGHGAPD